MNTKLTLTIEQAVIERAKLSDIIENYLKAITKSQETEEFSPLIKSLRGSFKAPKAFDYKEELSKELFEKHL